MRTIITAAAVVVITGLASAGAAASAPTFDPVPDEFRAQATTWTSASQGWVLGTADDASAPDTAASSASSPVIRTFNAGRTWRQLGSVPAPLASSGEPGVTEIDFANPVFGWAYGPSFYGTRDGGRSWQEAAIPGDGKQVIALAADRRDVYAVVSSCEIGTPPYECDQPSTLWHTPSWRTSWEQVPVELPVTFTATVEVDDGAAYVVVPTEPGIDDVFYSSADGREWSARPSPCRADGGESLIDLAAVSGSEAALLCIGDVGWSKATKRVFVTDDAGETTTPAGTAPRLGIHSQLAASPDGTLLVASASSGSWLYLNSGGGEEWTTPVEEGDGGADWSSPTFTTPDRGYVVYAPAAWADGEGTLLATRDGGQNWSPVPFQRN